MERSDEPASLGVGRFGLSLLVKRPPSGGWKDLSCLGSTLLWEGASPINNRLTSPVGTFAQLVWPGGYDGGHPRDSLANYQSGACMLNTGDINSAIVATLLDFRLEGGYLHVCP